MTAASDGVHSSLKAIQDMEAAVARFARTLVEQLPEVERELRQVTEALEDRRVDLRVEIERLEEPERSSPEGSADAIEYEDRDLHRLAEAQEELASVDRRLRRLEQIRSSYTKQADAVEALGKDKALQAKMFLSNAADDLKRYLALREPSITPPVTQYSTNQGKDSTGREIATLSFSTAEDALAWANLKMHPSHLPLSEEERCALVDYQLDSSPLNEALWNGIPLSERMQSWASNLDTALSRSKIPQTVTLWHGGKMEDWVAVVPGQIIAMNGFLSTTLAEQSRGFERGAWVEVEAPKDAPGLYVDDIAAQGFDQTEAEVLLPRGILLAVSSKELVDGILTIKTKLMS